MKIIKGKKWLQKTEFYIKESLKLDTATWIVDDSVKQEYEQYLLSCSTNGALLMHRVITMSEFFNESLLNSGLFKKKILDDLTAYMYLYQIVDCDVSIGMIKEYWQFFKLLNKQKVKNPNTANLNYFTKTKLEQVYQMYTEFKKLIEEDDYIFANDFEIEGLLIDRNENYYIDSIEYFDKQVADVLGEFDNCTVLVTSNNYGNISGDIIDFDVTVSPYQTYLTSNFETKGPKVNFEYDFKYVKALNPSIEVDNVAIKIYQMLASEQFVYKDIVVYYTSSGYKELISAIFNKHNLNINIKEKTCANYSKIYQVIKYFFKYLLEQNDNDLLIMLKTGLCGKLIDVNYINILEKELYTTSTCGSNVFIEMKEQINMIVTKFNNATTIKDKSEVLLDSFINEELFRGLDEADFIQQTKAYLNDLDKDFTIDNKKYVELFMSEYNIGISNNEQYIDAIDVCSIKETKLNKKIIFILGCNEGDFPSIVADTSYLLNDDIIKCKEEGIDLGLDLFEKLAFEYIDCFKVFYLDGHFTLSYATGTLSGDEKLASSLFNVIKNNFKGDTSSVDYNKTAKAITNVRGSIDVLYNFNHQDTEIENVRNMVEKYVNSKNQPVILNKDNYLKLLQKGEKASMTPSELEVYNGCAFKYYLRHGLNIFPWRYTTLQANDFGTIAHKLFEVLSDLIDQTKTIDDYFDINKMPLLAIETLEEDDLKLLSYIYGSVNQVVDSSEFDSKQKHFLNKVIVNVYNAIKILSYQQKLSQFKISKTEARLEKTYNDISVHGVVDRYDIYQNYVRVIDYKASKKELDIPLAKQGFNIQMLLYLDMLMEKENFEIGGVLYFSSKQRVIKHTNGNVTEIPKFDLLLKEYVMEGYLLDDEILINAVENTDSKSVVAKYSYVKSKSIYKGNLLDNENFTALLEAMKNRVETIIDEIYTNANISINPASSENQAIDFKVNPCRYCDYKTICLKDAFYNEGREISYLEEEEVE